MLCRTDNIMRNIFHIQYSLNIIRIECEEYFVELIIKCKIFFTFRLNVRYIPHNIASPVEHCYDFE